MQDVRLGETRYNPRIGTFEARVDVTRDGVVYRYPVRVFAPANADPDWIADALRSRALGMSDTPRLH